MPAPYSRYNLPPPAFDGTYTPPDALRSSPLISARTGQNRLDRQTDFLRMGKDPDPMHAQGGPYQRLLPGQTLGGAKAVGGMTTAPGNATVNGRMRYVGSPDYGATGGRGSTNSAHIGGKPRTYGNADEYYADHSNLRDFHAENSVDPVTGMKVKPSSFDMESKRAELARNGEWDALARLNNYTRAQASGDTQAVGAARGDIASFRAIRQAKQQYGSGPADKGAFAEDTRPPGDFSAPGSPRVNPFARDTRAPGDFGGGVDGGIGAMQEGDPYTRDTRAPGDFGGGGLAPEAGPQAPHPWRRNYADTVVGSSGHGVGPLAPQSEHPWLRNPYSLTNRGTGSSVPASDQKAEQSQAPSQNVTQSFQLGNGSFSRSPLGSELIQLGREGYADAKSLARQVPKMYGSLGEGMGYLRNRGLNLLRRSPHFKGTRADQWLGGAQ